MHLALLVFLIEIYAVSELCP